eukprot:jgi/Mesvir1/13279/Mv18597-RA.1
MTLYPFSSNIPTPTRRSPQAQQRVDELATKIFTPYELQKLRTYIPGIRFVIEEAEQYSQNILEDDPREELITKLRKFVGSVYIYDILTNLMRDINERVRRATDSALGETSVSQMAKLVNALRGFVAYGVDVDGAVKGTDGRILDADQKAANAQVYLYRIPADVLAKITLLQDYRSDPTVGPDNKEQRLEQSIPGVPGPGGVGLVPDITSGCDIHRLPVSGIASTSQAKYIRAFKLSHNALPSYSLLLGGDPTDCSIPARLIQQLASSEIDCSYLGIHHRERLSALGLDFPPDVKLAVVKSRQAVKKDFYQPRPGAAAVNYADTFSNNDRGIQVKTIDGTQSVVVHAHPFINGNPLAGTVPIDDFRFTSEYTTAAAGDTEAVKSAGMKPFYTFDNVIAKFIKRDILSFNRLRTSILNNIDQWAKSNGALLMVNNTGGTKGGPGYYSDLLTADYFVSGLPQPGCPSGSAPVFYDRDPSDPKARVVDQYIVAADNTLVENPDARYGPICQRRKGVRDIMSGAPDIDAMGGYANFPQHFMRAYRKRKPAARKSTRSRR